MYKRALGVILFGLMYLTGWGQTATDPNIQISNAVQAPASSVDLLQKSVRKNSPFAAPAKAPSVPTAKKTASKAATKAVPQPVERKMTDPQPAEVTQPAVSAEPTAAVKKPVEPAPTEKPILSTPTAKAGQPAPATPANGSEPSLQTAPAAQVQSAAAASEKVPSSPAVAEKPAAIKQVTAPSRQRKNTQNRKRGKTAPRVTAPAETPAVVEKPAATQEPAASLEEDAEEDAADAELEYAVKMLERSKQQAAQSRPVPPPAAKNKPKKVPAAHKKFNPNAYRPGVEWIPSKSKHFDIYTQKPNGKIGSANMAMMFETAYDTLWRFIPWMMAGPTRVRVFVYQDHDSYLRYEPEAKAWTQAISYPTRGEIVVYDAPGHAQELKETFAHELTHIFTQQFFDKHHTGRIMTPTWLDEGLAVLVQDHMFAGREGGPWNNDYLTLNFERDPKTMPANFSSSRMFGGFKPKPFVPISQRQDPVGPRRGKSVRLKAFEDFMREGSLEAAEGQEDLEHWYLQAYLMVRFLLSPGGGNSASNRMQFEQFTRLMAEGEPVRNPATGFLVKDARGKQVYEPCDVEKAFARSPYRYSNAAVFEDNFWKWLNK